MYAYAMPSWHGSGCITDFTSPEQLKTLVM